MNQTIVIYHGGCRDGFCAAWVVNKYFTMEGSRHRRHETGVYPIEYYPGFYGQEPPDVKDKNVIIVDFSYDVNTMIKIYTSANSLIWLDHHKTAQPVADMFSHLTDGLNEGIIKYVFDNNRSGAGITWDYFFPNESRPWIVDYVEDRDLWRHKLEWSEQINAFIAALEFRFELWDEYFHADLKLIKSYGIVAKMKTEQYVREVCKNVYFVEFDSGTLEERMLGKTRRIYDKIPTVNICQVDCSEVLAELLKLYPSSPFSLYWMKRADGMYQYGMRSIGDFDVSAVAKLFGGGGHKNAAGFQLNYLLEELK